MKVFHAASSFLWLSIVSVVVFTSSAEKQPIIFDSDYGPFIDDVFALGLLINSQDLVDIQLVLATSEQPALSAQCMAAQLGLSEQAHIPVAVGSSFPPYEERGSVCAIPGLMGFSMEPECLAYFGDNEASNETTAISRTTGGNVADIIPNGVEHMAQMLMNSDREDWWYLVVGGQSSLRALIENYPEAASKVDTLIVMAGNWCADFEPYPGVMAPSDETNIGCDPAAANFVLDSSNGVKFSNVYYVPVVMADEIGGDDYKVFADAALSGSDPAAAATMNWYKIWSAAGRADESLLVHAEAMTYDPETESTPQFDPVAIMLALELLSDACEEPRMSLIEMDGIHFFEAGEGMTDLAGVRHGTHFLLANDLTISCCLLAEGLKPFPEAPRSAFSLHTGVDPSQLPAECPNITEFVFDPETTPEVEYPVKVALGYTSPEAKAAVYSDMARRMAGQQVLCGAETPKLDADSGLEDPLETDSSAGDEILPSLSGLLALGIFSFLLTL